MIPLDRIKACTNPECRAILPADPDDEPSAGFWAREREGGAGSRVRRWYSHCKDCVKKSRARGPRRQAESWMVEHEGRWVQARRCVNPDCGKEGLCLDGPESDFHIKGRDDEGRVTQWSALCKKCHYARHRSWKRENKEVLNARRRERYRERMATDPNYVAARRERGRKYYADNPERREAQRVITQRWRERQKEVDPQKVSELARIDHRLRRERAGKPLAPKRGGTVIDGTSPRIPATPFRRWLQHYALATGYAGNEEELARHLGIQPRRVRSLYAEEYDQVALDVVSRALTNAQAVVSLDGRMIVTLDDLYEEETDAR